MTNNSFFLNKYTLSVLIVLLCLFIDIALHKGVTRVMVPDSFTHQRTPVEIPSCKQELLSSDKNWVKGVNTPELAMQLPANTPGFEMDVYFDTIKNYLQVYHDSTVFSETKIEEILAVYQQRNLKACIWLDFKNLSGANQPASLKYIKYLRSKYNLHNKLIIESSTPSSLPAFCDSGFFTSYYIPFFNPYKIDEKELVTFIDTIQNNLSRYRVSALSGYYFQYPVLKKYFPGYPVLTWVENDKVSIITGTFGKVLANDDRVAVILRPLNGN